MSFAGLHPICSALSNDTYVALPVITTSISSPVVGRERLNNNVDPTWPPVWNITAVGEEGSNLYTVSWGSDPIIIVGNGLRVFFLGAPGPAANFSIESEGNNLVCFHVPDQNGEWTLADNGTANPGIGTPITLESDQGLPGQRWTLENLD